MNFKQYLFPPDIRVCVYNVGGESLEFHRHHSFSDLTYCASGKLLLELPEIDKGFVFHVGQVVQVPVDTIHRISHISTTCDNSRYVLVQIGEFSIDFIKEDFKITTKLDIRDISIDFFIGKSVERLEAIKRKFKIHPPVDMLESELEDVLAALDLIVKNGIQVDPNRDVLFQKYQEITI